MAGGQQHPVTPGPGGNRFVGTRLPLGLAQVVDEAGHPPGGEGQHLSEVGVA